VQQRLVRKNGFFCCCRIYNYFVLTNTIGAELEESVEVYRSRTYDAAEMDALVRKISQNEGVL
jgi:hypothetical protein